MTRQLDVQREARQEKQDKQVIVALEYGLAGAIGHAGGTLQGLAFKFGPDDCLLVVKAVVAGKRQVAFVGSGTMIGAILKCVREAKTDNLRWREDRWRK